MPSSVLPNPRRSDAPAPFGVAPAGWVPTDPVLATSYAGLALVPTFDANLNSSARTAITAALAPYPALFADLQSYGIYFYNMSSGLGESNSYGYYISYQSFRAQLAAHATSADDGAAIASLPTGAIGPLQFPSTASLYVAVKPATGRMLGLNTPDVAFSSGNCAGYTGIGCIGINVTLATSMGNLASVVQHEVNELLGLGSALSGTLTDANLIPWPEDLFRWASPGVRSFAANFGARDVACGNSTPRAYLSADGGVSAINDFNNCGNGWDYGDWIIHTPSQIQDGFTYGTAAPTMSSTVTEMRALDIIGYRRAVTVPAAMTSPTPGSTLSGSTVTFQWSAGSGTQFWLDLGSSPGGVNLYSALQAGTSVTVTGLPTNGSTLYARLWTLQNGTWSYVDYTFVTGTSAGAKAVMTSPANGATMGSDAIIFIWTAGGGTRYWLDIGTTVGGNDLYSVDQGAGLAVAVTTLPTNGSRIYVRLWTFVNGAWASNDYSYVTVTNAGTKAVMTSPSNGSSLTGSTATFQWNGGTGTRFWLDVGTSVGANNLFSADRGANLSATVTGLPTNGSTVYVRLWTFLNGGWVSNDYSYVAATNAGTRAVMTSPANGSTLPGTTATFQWSGGTGTRYWLDIGTTVGGNNLFSADRGANLNATVDGLPANGSTLYVRLWTFLNGTWVSNDYSYVAATITGTKAAMTSPANGSTLSGSSVSFQWSAGTGTRYWLDIGTSVGANNLFSADRSANLNATVTGLPTNGSTVYVRLWTFLNGTWVSNDYSYIAASNAGTKATMTSPANGTTLTGASVSFTWTAGTGTRYWLDIGTSVGGNTIFSADRSANTNATVTGLPTDGRTLYVRLWTFLNGSWVSNDYVYTAANGAGNTGKAAITSPTSGATLHGSSATFQWTAGGGTRYWLDVGSSVGGNTIFSADRGASLSGTATGLPTDGRTVYVRLWTFLNGAWVSNDYTYVTGP